MLDRYKKKGGFLQLLLLIETSSPQKQESFLNLIAQESPAWEEAIKKKTLSVEKILLWDPIYLAEIFSRIQPLTIAVALRSFSEAQTAKILNCFTPSEQRKIQNIITETNPSANEIASCTMKIIAEVRELMKRGVLKLEKIDPEMVVPENIEEQLQQKTSLQGALASSAALVYDEKPKQVKTRVDSEPSSAPVAKPTVELKVVSRPPNEEAKVAPPLAPQSGDSVGALKDEIEVLKVKNRQIQNENQLLREEISVLKSKLEQIRKIA